MMERFQNLNINRCKQRILTVHNSTVEKTLRVKCADYKLRDSLIKGAIHLSAMFLSSFVLFVHYFMVCSATLQNSLIYF